jgi:hypothetical protein
LWQALFRLHARRGDRVALMRELQRLRESLSELADEADSSDDSQLYEPSGEVLQEYERLLASLRERDREPAGV